MISTVIGIALIHVIEAILWTLILALIITGAVVAVIAVAMAVHYRRPAQRGNLNRPPHLVDIYPDRTGITQLPASLTTPQLTRQQHALPGEDTWLTSTDNQRRSR